MSKSGTVRSLEDIEALPKEILTPADIAPILGCQPYAINVATENGENPFNFPVYRMGRRVKIPKKPFLKAMRGESAKESAASGAGTP